MGTHKMVAKDLEQKGSTLKVNLAIYNLCDCAYSKTRWSPEYVIGCSAVFQVKVNAACYYLSGHYHLTNWVFIRFVKRCPEDDLTYSIMFTSSKFGITNKSFTSDDGTWHLVHENKNLQEYTIDVAIHMDIVPSTSYFSSLHEDMKLTDFELRGVDGSVGFHKAVLAASSPVLEKKLTENWRATTEGHIKVPETSKKILQDLKNYMYLRTLPDEDLKQLAVLAANYNMPELEQRCAHRLLNIITHENACDLLEFAVLNKVSRLVVGILECTQNRAVDVNKIYGHLLRIERGACSADNQMIKYNKNEEVGDEDS